MLCHNHSHTLILSYSHTLILSYSHTIIHRIECRVVSVVVVVRRSRF